MKYASQIACLLFLVTFSNLSFGMMRVLTRKPTSSWQYQQLSPQRRMMQTRAVSGANKTSAVTTNKTSPVYNYMQTLGRNIWAWLTGRSSQAPAVILPQSIALPKSMTEPLTTSAQTASNRMSINKPEPSIITQLQTAQTLSEMKQALENNEKMEQNKQQKLLNISNEQWLAMLKKEEEHFAWIKTNCFKNKNITSDDRAKIPKERYAQILACLKTIKIDPFSVKLIWEAITTPDIFGHKTIITNGPILKDNNEQLKQIPTITFDPDKVSTLSPEEFDFELYHAITHLIQGDHDKLHLLKNTVEAEKFNQYTQSQDGKKYLQTMENTADFLIPIDNMNIGHIFAQVYFKINFHDIITNIKEKFTKIRANNIDTSSVTKILISPELQTEVEKTARLSGIYCPDPTENIMELLKMPSLAMFAPYIKAKKMSILRQMGFTDEDMAIIERKLPIGIEKFIERYKQPHNVKQDENLPPAQREMATFLLTLTGLNPSRVFVKSSTDVNAVQLLPIKNRSLTNLIMKPNVFLENALDEILQLVSSNWEQVIFLQPIENTNSPNHDVFIIAHEIGHFMQGHVIEIFALQQLLLFTIPQRDKLHNPEYGDTDRFEKTMKALSLLAHEYSSLQELEADLWMAMRYEKIAEMAHLSSIEMIRQEVTLSSIYLSPAEKLYVFAKILQLHKSSREI